MVNINEFEILICPAELTLETRTEHDKGNLFKSIN